MILDYGPICGNRPVVRSRQAGAAALSHPFALLTKGGGDDA